MTERFIEALSDLACGLQTRVLVGPLNPRRDALIALSRRSGSETVVDSASIEEHALWCDLALTCLGGTASELACLGVPNLAVAVHPKQIVHQDRYADLGLIVSLGVGAIHRGNGIGRRLLREAHRWCQQARVECMRLKVAQDNTVALALYRSQGYRVVGTLPHYYGVGRDGLRMERRAPRPGVGRKSD
jgi:ribosomal protein S18 acetylase RimI-like enzyme